MAAFQIHLVCQNLMRGFGKLKPSQPRWQWEDAARDPGLIIQYWIDQPDNDRLTDAELAFKSFALFAIAVWPRCSDAARVVRSSGARPRRLLICA